MTDHSSGTIDAVDVAPDTRFGLHLFADGCFEPQSGNGGWGFVIYRDDIEIASGSGGVEDTANNAAEVAALLAASSWVAVNAPLQAAVIWSDSVYAVNGCNNWRPIWRNNGWKKISANKNLRSRVIASVDLWKSIDAILSRNPLLVVAWCKGHAGTPGNERADMLAEQGRLSLGKQPRS
ncbi:ribonuclease HI [Rhizobium sp. S152]|uniref:RNase H family protein n=1 Tax=Rhizobium sp. S152 TaxID=3055038 RepID=UPI0025A99E1F|nr:RNase H family protein [Rhizobium sp. S152]MDM9626961.1 ribonuclease HI [Rhizobium sp. S152]